MKFLNGFKTILGIASLVATTVISALGKDTGFIPGVVQTVSDMGDHVGALVGGAGALLTVLGIIHKREKAKLQ